MLKRAVFILMLLAFSFQASAFADTVTLKSGKEVKGIVVEDYASRIIISTIDGEQTIMKDEIREVFYDTEEDNLIKLADRARQKRNYIKACDLYEKALKMNPRSKAAQDGMVFCQSNMVRRQEADKASDIARREEFERYGGFTGGQTAKNKEDDLNAKLNDALGITLVITDGTPRVDSVRLGSQAYDAGVRMGDHLIAVWSRLTGYMSLEEVIDILLEKTSFEVKVTIERTVDVNVNPARGAISTLNDLIGAALVMKFDGLTADQVMNGGNADRAGLKDGDLITAIDGQQTRYMPLKKAVDIVRSSKGTAVKITLRREIVIWRMK